MIETSSKRRYEISGDRIRALYGHSFDRRIRMDAAPPPEALFHGTTPSAAGRILTEGLRPMGRQYVHLSVDVPTAIQVGRRRTPDPVVLSVRARDAHTEGVAFFPAGDVWLAEEVPARFLDRA